MTRRFMDLLASDRPDGTVDLRSPAVGVVTAAPLTGERLGPGSPAGMLKILGRVHDLRVPAGVAGSVREMHVRNRSQAVAYGETILTVVPDASARASGEDARPRRSDRAGAGGQGGASPSREGCVLRAPTAGVFYARPDPGAPPFVAVGAILETGQTAALIEVMKTFSPIVHPGGEIPSPARVESVAAKDGDEVQSGQALFVLRPA